MNKTAMNKKGLPSTSHSDSSASFPFPVYGLLPGIAGLKEEIYG